MKEHWKFGYKYLIYSRRPEIIKKALNPPDYMIRIFRRVLKVIFLALLKPWDFNKLRITWYQWGQCLSRPNRPCALRWCRLPSLGLSLQRGCQRGGVGITCRSLKRALRKISWGSQTSHFFKNSFSLNISFIQEESLQCVVRYVKRVYPDITDWFFECGWPGPSFGTEIKNTIK